MCNNKVNGSTYSTNDGTSHAETSLRSFLMNLSFTTYSYCYREATEELTQILYLSNAI